MITFVIIYVVVVQNGGFCKKKKLSNFIIILGMQQRHFQFFTWKKFDNYLTKN
jgi:hypothetical protein